MRKIILSLLISSTTFLHAQIQITSSNMPSIDDTIRYSLSSSLTANFKQTGANYKWDYSSLNLVSQDIYKFQKLSSTPYSTLLISGLPAGAIGYKIADSIGTGQFAIKNLYNFYEKKTNVWRAVGTGFTLSLIPFPAGAVYSDYDEIYTFPLSYNDKDSTTFAVTTPLGNQFLKLGTYTQKGYRLNHVEGWGTITTPYGSNIQCIKIKSTVVERDSVSISTPAFNQAFDANRVEYRWLSTTEKIPVLEVIGTEIGGTFTPTQVRYRDNFRVPQQNPASPRARFSVNKILGDAGKDTFTFTNNSQPPIGNTYQWSFTPNKGIRFVSTTNSSSTSPKVIFDSAGIFSVNLRASNLAGFDDSTVQNMITINGTNTGTNAIAHQTFGVFPNPSSGIFYLTDPKTINSVYFIFDNNGKLVQQGVVDQSLTLNASQLAIGTYQLLLKGSDSIAHTQIIIH